MTLSDMNDHLAILPSHNVSDVHPTLPNYAGMLDVLLSGMSDNSKRQYEHTYDDWRMWCATVNIPANELSAPNVMRYLQSRNLARATRQARARTRTSS